LRDKSGTKARFNNKETVLTHKRTTTMKSLGYLGAFLGGAIAGAAIGILVAPEKGQDTRVKITDAIEDFMKKHNIKLSRKEVGDLVDDIQDLTDDEE
jgi:gas vesicle protein